MFFSTQIKAFGLDISDKNLKLAQITNTASGFRLLAYNKIDLPEETITNGEIKNKDELIKSIKKIINDTNPKIEGNYVVACLPEIKTFIKLIKIKKTQDKLTTEQLKDLVKNELSQHIPLPVEEVDFDWQIIRQNQNEYEILIGVAPRQTVLEFSNILKESGLIPVALEIEAQPIIRAIFYKNFQKQLLLKDDLGDIQKILNKLLSKNQPVSQPQNTPAYQNIQPDTVYFIIDCGAARSGLIVWTNETIELTSSLKTCGNDMTQIISQKLKIEIKAAEKLKKIYGLTGGAGKANLKILLRPIVLEMCQEILHVKSFYQAHFTDNQEKKYEIILTGGAALLTGLDSELSKILKMKVTLANPLININTAKTNLKHKDFLSYNTAIGLALRQLFTKEI